MRSFLTGPRFERRVPLEAAGDVIRWWESRRLYFNVVVGCTGIVTVVLTTACAFVAEAKVGEAIGLSDGPLLEVFGILFYGILANVCYTAGWICELIVRSTGAKISDKFGIRTFKIGVVFSIVLTLCPAVLVWVAFALALLYGQTHGPVGDS